MKFCSILTLSSALWLQASSSRPKRVVIVAASTGSRGETEGGKGNSDLRSHHGVFDPSTFDCGGWNV